MASFKFDPSKHGLRKTLKEYEEISLRYIWTQGEEGASTGKTWNAVNEALGPDKSISDFLPGAYGEPEGPRLQDRHRERWPTSNILPDYG